MTVESIVAELCALGEPRRVAALRRDGIGSDAFGVGLPALRALAKRIGRDHALALALWKTAIREARILASLVDEPDRVTAAQMDAWAGTFDSWEVCDQCCQNLFHRTPFALAKVEEWTQRPEELVKRAGFVLVAVLAVHDHTGEDATFVRLLPTLIDRADDERHYVRKGAGWALRQIGKRSDASRAQVLTALEAVFRGDRRPRRRVARDVIRELGSRPGPSSAATPR